MAAKQFFLPFPVAFTSNGLPAGGAKLYFYDSGTTDPLDTYTTFGLSVEHAHPVVANGAGRFPDIYLDDQETYRLIIKDRDGGTLDDIDPYIPGTFGLGSQPPSYTMAELPPPVAGITVFVTDVDGPGQSSGVPAFSDGSSWYSHIDGLAIGRFRYHVQFGATLGQSLGQSHTGGTNETLSQIGNSLAFPLGDDTPTIGEMVPAVATNLTLSGGSIPVFHGENPMFGHLGFTYEIAEREMGFGSTMIRVGVTNASGSSIIAQNIKGQPNYNRTIADVAVVKAYAIEQSKKAICFGNQWFQGESDPGQTKAAYQATLQQLARDYADDIRDVLPATDAVSADQTFDPILFTYACCSNPVNTAQRSSVARAQFQAAVDYYRGTIPSGHSAPAPVVLTMPSYFMGYQFDVTGLHIPAHWAYTMGAYTALAEERIFLNPIDPSLPINERWAPIHPIAVTIAGNQATIQYKMRAPDTALEFGVSDFPNGEGVAEQEDYGFAVWNGTTLVGIETPEIIAADTIRITLSAGTFSTGYRIGYGLDRAMDHHLYFTGSGGNVRDNYGDQCRCEAMNYPMHNWLSPHDITLDASAAGWTLS